MLLRELTSDLIVEKQIWARSGKKVVRKYRCAGGQRHGRIVATCTMFQKDMKKRFNETHPARLGKRIARKARRTKRLML